MSDIKVTEVEDDKYLCNDDYEDCRPTGKKIVKFYFTKGNIRGSVSFLPKKPCKIVQMWITDMEISKFVVDYAISHARKGNCDKLTMRIHETDKYIFSEGEFACKDNICEWMKKLNGL